MEIENDNTLAELYIDSLADAKMYIADSQGKSIEDLTIDLADGILASQELSILGEILGAPSDVKKLEGYFFACSLTDATFEFFLTSLSKFQS
jgi:hypothetical protein